MSKLILLVVAAAWAGVLLPPLLRSRLDARPGTSISSFRRQLSSLQRTAPGAVPQVRSMARPLSGPTRHGYAPGYQQVVPQRSSTVVTMAREGHRPERVAQRPIAVRAPQRSLAKQRRQNVLVILLMGAVAFGFLTAVTTASFARYGLALSVCLLVGYVYLLVQTRRNELARSSYGAWQRAA
ncbi:MAG: hypothetical protein R2705_02730 [Ilumatobacteraceae bacterium]